MELSKQVVSLDLAKRLKELGVKQESHFYWAVYPNELSILTTKRDGEYLKEWVWYSAFTVAELLQMLKEPVLVPVDGSAADYLAGLIINMHQNGKGVSRR